MVERGSLAPLAATSRHTIWSTGHVSFSEVCSFLLPRSPLRNSPGSAGRQRITVVRFAPVSSHDDEKNLPEFG